MTKNKVILCFLTIILFISFVLITVGNEDISSDVPLYISVSSEGKTEQISCWKKGDTEYCVFLPSYAKLSKSQLHLTADTTVKINGSALADGMYCEDFEMNVAYPISYSSFGKTYESSITFLKSEQLPAMYITTKSGNMDYIHKEKGNEESGKINIYYSDGTTDFAGDLDSINGRGNYTWDEFDKKPYSLSFSRNVDLLGMGAAQKWILLANADDPSNIRNKIVYDFAEQIGLPFSPDSRWVDLYLNGEYAGLYLLCERNEVHPERVDIHKDNSFLVSLGLEDRMIAQNYPFISTQSGQALRIHYPLRISDTQKNSLALEWQTLENALIADDGIDSSTGKSWEDIIDLSSWVKKYLIEEVFGNYDACSISQFFYRDGTNGKIYSGPVWDYDHAIGNEVTWQLKNPKSLLANRLYVRDGFYTPWFHYLYQKTKFYEKTVAVYEKEFKPLLEKLVNEKINEYYSQIKRSAELNRIRWFSESTSLSEQTEYIRTYMTERIEFLNNIWLNNSPYHLVRADSGFGVTYAYYAVYSNECLDNLHNFEDNESSEFIGWYYVDTDEPFDITKPITKDINIYAKWKATDSNKADDILKLIPVGIIALIFIVILIVEIKRIKSSGWRKNERK